MALSPKGQRGIILHILNNSAILWSVARGKKRTRGKRKPQQGRFLRVRTAGIRFLNQCAFVVLVLLGCVAVALLSVPQVKELKRLETEQTYALQQEEEALARKDQKRRELDAIRDNPEYLELIARDRLNLYRKGETIIRVHRENEL